MVTSPPVPAVAEDAAIPRADRLLRWLVGAALVVGVVNLTLGERHVRTLTPDAWDGQAPRRASQPGRGDRLAALLRGEAPFSGGADGRRLRYRPGTLAVPPAEALRHCFVNATLYARHLPDPDPPRCLVSLSERLRLIYRTVPKSASSSARHVMQDFLDGRDKRLAHDAMEDKVRRGGYHMISFVREPLDRFFSSYDEAFFRMGPWIENGTIGLSRPDVRNLYFQKKHLLEPFPYLYEGLSTARDYRRMYCPKHVLKAGGGEKCNEVPSADDGTLLRRFERFARDYGGLRPFDVHLHLQVGHLVFPSGAPMPVTTLYNASDAERGWQEAARAGGVEIPDGEMTHGRKMARRFDVSRVARATKRKICRILALDYCCLNIALPAVCQDVVYCAMERRDDATMAHALTPVVIHPWKDPQT